MSARGGTSTTELEARAIELPWAQDAGKMALTVDAVLTAAECKALMGRADDAGWLPSPMAPLQSGLRSRVEDAAWAQRVFERLRAVLPAVHLGRRIVGLTSTLRLVKYESGAEVLPHPDTAGGDKHTPVSKPHSSLMTCLLYLNDGYEGCETHLLPSPRVAKKDTAEDAVRVESSSSSSSSSSRNTHRDEACGWPEVCAVRGIKVAPKVGRALIFSHDVLHGCPPLRTGPAKVVCRVDVVYEETSADTGERIGCPFLDSTLDEVSSSTTARTKKNFRAFAKALTRRRPAPVFVSTTKDALKGGTAVVTGASTGLGAAVCAALAQELGMRVVGIGRRPEPAASVFENCPGLDYRSLDVTDEPKAAALLAETKPIVLVNNAGLSLPDAVVRNGNQAASTHVFAVNTLAPLHWTRECLRLWERDAAPFGHVVNVASLSAHRVASSNLGVYAASKHALKALTEATRLDLRKARLPYRVSMISPGLVADTDFYARQGPRRQRTGSCAADLLAAAPSLKPADVVHALLCLLTAPPGCEVHDILLRATDSRD